MTNNFTESATKSSLSQQTFAICCCQLMQLLQFNFGLGAFPQLRVGTGDPIRGRRTSVLLPPAAENPSDTTVAVFVVDAIDQQESTCRTALASSIDRNH